MVDEQVLERNVVSMEFDNAKFERKAKKTTKTLKNLKKEMNFEDVDYSEVESGLDKVIVKFDALRIAAETAMTRMVNSAINAGERMVKALSIDNVMTGYMKYTEKVSAVQTMLASNPNLTMEQIEATMQRLEWFTDETSYNLSSMQANMSKFMASGIGLEDAAAAVEGIALWAAESGQNAQTASNAMYQLSQALGRGTIKWMDWQSIVTANMSTEGIQKRLIEAGKEVGTITGSTASLSFQEMMAKGVFTTEVFLKAMERYTEFSDLIYDQVIIQENYDTTSDAIKNLGASWKTANEDGLNFSKTAFAAAQEAKTFSEVIDAVKTAVATGWSKTFEFIIGSYEVVKTKMTDLSNVLYDIFVEPGNERNSVLRQWAEDAKYGSREDLWEAFFNIMEAVQNAINAVKEAWSEVFEPITVAKIQEIVSKIKAWSEELKNNEKAINVIKKAAKVLFKVLKVGLRLLDLAWNIVAPIADFLFDIALNITDVALSLMGLNYEGEEAKDTLASFIPTGKQVRAVVEGIIESIKNAYNKLDEFVLNLTGKDIKGWFNEVIEMVRLVIQTIGAFFSVLQNDDIENKSENFTEKLTGLGEKLGGFVGGILEFLKSTFTFLEPMLVYFEGLGPDLQEALVNIAKFVGGVLTFIVEKVSNLFEKLAAFDPKTIFGIILAIVGVIKIIQTINLARYVKQILKEGYWLADELRKAVMANNIRTILKAVADAILEMAIAFAVVFIVCKRIDWKSGITSLLIFGSFVALSIVLTKTLAKSASLLSTGRLFGMVGYAVAFAGMAVAYMGMAKAMVMLAEIDAEAVGRSAVGLLAITAALILVMRGLKKASLLAGAKMLGFTLVLPLVAANLIKFCEAILPLEEISIDKLENAFAKFMALAGALTILMRISSLGIKLSRVLGSILTIAAIIFGIKLLVENIDTLSGYIDDFSSDLLDKISDFGLSIMELTGAISVVLVALGIFSRLTAAKKVRAGNYLAFGVMIGIIAGAIYVIWMAVSSIVDVAEQIENQNNTDAVMDRMYELLTIIAGIMGAIMAFVIVILAMTRMSKVKGDIGKTLHSRLSGVTMIFTVLLLDLAGITAVIWGLMMMSSQITPEQGDTMIALLSVILSIFVAMFTFTIILTGMVRMSKVDPKIANSLGKRLSGVSGLIVTLTISLVLITATMYGLMWATDKFIALGEDGQDKFYTLVAAISGIFGVLMLLTAVLVAVTKGKTATDVKALGKVNGTIITLTVTIVLISATLYGLMWATEKLIALGDNASKFYTIVGIVGGIFMSMMGLVIAMQAIAKGFKANGVKSLALVMGVMSVMTGMFVTVAGAIYAIIAFMPENFDYGKISMILGSIVVVIGGIISSVMALTILAKSSSKSLKMLPILATTIGIMLTIFTLVAGFGRLSTQIDVGSTAALIIAFVSILGALYSGILFLSKITAAKIKNLNSLIPIISIISGIILAISGSMALMSLANSSKWYENIVLISGLLGIFGSVVASFAVLSKLTNGVSMTKLIAIAAMMSGVITSVSALVGMFAILASVANAESANLVNSTVLATLTILGTMAVFAGALGGMTLMSGGKGFSALAIGVLVLDAFAASIMLTAKAFEALANAVDKLNAAFTGKSKIAQAYSDTINDIGIDLQNPTITPVVDLSQVELGIAQMNSMFAAASNPILFNGSAQFAANAINPKTGKPVGQNGAVDNSVANFYITIEAGGADPEEIANEVEKIITRHERTISMSL